MIIQNDIGNRYSPVTIVAAIVHAGLVKDPASPLVVPIDSATLSFSAFVLCDQIHSVAQERLGPEVGFLNSEDMRNVDTSLAQSLFGLAIRALYSGNPSQVESESFGLKPDESPLIVNPRRASTPEDKK